MAPIITTRPMAPHEADACEGILRELPEWFGIPSAIDAYRRALDRLDTYVATAEGEMVGFVAVEERTEACTEIHVMAVREAYHRRGVGRALVEAAGRHALERSKVYLSVKTLGPSHPDASYAQTRRFYTAMGFLPIEETNLWGEANPCLILVKHLECGKLTPHPPSP